MSVRKQLNAGTVFALRLGEGLGACINGDATMRSNWMKWTSIGLFAALSLFLVVFGTIYATVQNLLWFHAAAVPKQALQDVRPLYFALMTLIGGASGGLGLLGLYVTFGPVRRGMSSGAVVLAVANSVALVMAAITAEKLAVATGSPTSWHIMGALMTINLSALALHFGAKAPTRKTAMA